MLALLAARALAQQPPECPFGVNAHQAEDAALDRAAAAGIGWVRFDFNWLQMEPAEDVMDWSVTDRLVDAAAARGLHIYVSVGYTPAWAVSTACDDSSPNPDDHCLTRLPADDAEWTEFVRLCVERYGDRVKSWGLWNEPNLSQFFAGTREEWVTHILVPGADTVHATCADCKVVGPELANLREAHWDADQGVCVLGECTFNGWDYSLRQILTDAGDKIDVVSHHKYEDPVRTWWDELLNGEWLLGTQYVHGLREITDDLAPGKPVWITEVGWETTPGGTDTPAYAADELTQLYDALPHVQAGDWPASPDPWPELQKIFWYDLADDPSGPSWGLLQSDDSPKPAYDAYAQEITALGGCEAFVPGTTTTPPADTGTPPATTDTGPATVPTGDTAPPPPAAPAETSKGCGCDGAPASAGALAWLLLAPALRRRQRGVQTRCAVHEPGV